MATLLRLIVAGTGDQPLQTLALAFLVGEAGGKAEHALVARLLAGFLESEKIRQRGDALVDTEGLTEILRLERPKTYSDSINGYLITTRSRYVRWRFAYTLFLNREQMISLQELFAESVGRLDFIDHRGFSWLVEAGTNDATHAYATGADIENQEMLMNPTLAKNYDACEQRWRIPIVMIVAARGLAGNTANVIEESTCMTHDVPSGTINGINATFTVSQTYSTFLLFKNRQEMKLTVDYNLSGSTITFVAGAIPQTADSLDGYGVL